MGLGPASLHDVGTTCPAVALRRGCRGPPLRAWSWGSRRGLWRVVPAGAGSARWGQGPEESASELRAWASLGSASASQGHRPAGPPAPPAPRFPQLSGQGQPRSHPGSRPHVPLGPLGSLCDTRVHKGPELALEGGAARPRGGAGAGPRPRRTPGGPWLWPSRPGTRGCFLFCERVVFSIQNNKRGSSGLAVWRGHCPPSPGPGDTHGVPM